MNSPNNKSNGSPENSAEAAISFPTLIPRSGPHTTRSFSNFTFIRPGRFSIIDKIIERRLEQITPDEALCFNALRGEKRNDARQKLVLHFGTYDQSNMIPNPQDIKQIIDEALQAN